ncbi:glycosyltransferase family 2 protein [Moritella dasanensis]|uniref:glycosyltransferase family 2 protein n=1 Tax=Moritella dasanensis TaxID=428031 RepID=UPI0002FC053E|nr:glycosyltransferase [Moritella dasanensis]
MNPQVSVIMPAYNVDKFIGEAIDSVLSQTFTDFELIIIDDCSTDNTRKEIIKKKNIDNRIQFHCNSENLGIAETLNKALKMASGKYIIRMDSDDISLPNRFELLLTKINDSDIDILGTSTITINENGDEIGSYETIVEHDDLVATIGLSSPLLHIWICKKELYEKVGNYRYPPVEDYDFLLRCIKKGYRLGNLNDKLYKVRLRSGNTVDLYGYKQLKAFEASYANFQTGKELPSLKEDRFISLVQASLYTKSYKIMMIGSLKLKKGYKIQAGILFIISSLLSTYQFRYLYRRLKLSLYKNKIK